MKWLIPSPIYGWALLAVFVAGGLLSGGTAWTVRGWQADARVFALENAHSKEKIAHLEAINKSTNEARAAEKRERAMISQIEVAAHENAQRTNRILADNRRLARELGGLRDPYAYRCTDLSREAGTPGSLEDRAAKGEFPRTPAGLLSPEAGEFLLEFAAQCDAAADYAQAGHDYAMSR